MQRAMRVLIPSLLLVASGQATTILNTGQSGPNDPIWTITAGGSGPAQVISNPITIANSGPWADAPANSAWVSTTTANSLPANTTYTLTTTFSGDSGDILSFRALADNQLDVYLDGNLVYQFVGTLAGHFGVLPPAEEELLGYTGVHTIDLVVRNTSGFSGVLFVAETPEPGTFLLGGLSIGALLLVRKRQTA